MENQVSSVFTSIEILRQIQKDLKDRQISPNAERIIFMSMFNDIDWTTNEWKFFCMYFECQRSKCLRKRVSARTLVIPRSWKWGKMVWDVCSTNQKEDGTSKAAAMIEVVVQSGHPVFRGMCSQPRNTKRTSGRNTIHFTADSGKIWLKMWKQKLVNQVSVYGAVSSWCKDLSQCTQGQGIYWSEHVHFKRKKNSHHNSWIRKKLVLWQ